MIQRNLGACSQRELAALFGKFCFRRVQVSVTPKSADHGVRQRYALTGGKKFRSGGEKELRGCTDKMYLSWLAGDLRCSGRI